MLETHRAGKVPLKALDCRCTPGAVACADALSAGFLNRQVVSHDKNRQPDISLGFVGFGVSSEASVDSLK